MSPCRLACLLCGAALLCGGCGARREAPEAHRAPPPAPAHALALGARHGCARLDDGRVACWGANDHGQLGTDGPGTSVPVDAVAVGRVETLGCGPEHCCGVRASGSVVCWGRGSRGELGVPVAAREATRAEGRPLEEVPGIRDAARVAPGGAHTCVLLRNGGVRCFGDDARGQLGSGRPIEAPAAEGAAIAVAITDVRALASGAQHTCAAKADGSVLCWGDDHLGQLGDGEGPGTAEGASTVPVPVHGLGDAVDLAAGLDTTCARRRSGAVVCWGARLAVDGELRAPLAIPSLAGSRALGVGDGHACGLVGSAVRCVGANDDGELGDGTTTPRLEGAADAAVTNAVAVAAGAHHACAVLVDGHVRCWGSNRFGQLGDGRVASHAEPHLVPDLVGVTDLRAGGHVVCTRGPDARWRCAGDNERRLIDLVSGRAAGRPTPLRAAEDAPDLALARGRLCVRRASGEVACRGTNPPIRAALLDETRVTGLAGVVGLGVSAEFACAASDDGRVGCWGSNASGELGRGDGPARLVARPVADLLDARTVATGEAHACALTRAGAVVCWGSDASGQLGDGDAATRHRPRAVAGLPESTAVAAGALHTCALTTAGEVWCWGSNRLGQLGDGTRTSRPSPVRVGGLGDAFALTAGLFHTCALTRGGDVVCWGGGALGQLGRGVREDAPTAAPATLDAPALARLGPATCVAAGALHTCACLASGAVACWGFDGAGQLGLGAAPVSSRARQVTGLRLAQSVDGVR